MPDFNKVLLVGNLTADPRLKRIGQTAMTAFGVATNRKSRKPDGTVEDRVCFVDIVAWDRLAETCARYLKKGKLALIEGSLEYRTWEEDGKRRSKLEVHARTVLFLSPPDRPDDGDAK